MSHLLKSSRTIQTVVLLLTLGLSVHARADLWEVFVTDNGPLPDITAGDSSLPDLVTNLVNSQGAFPLYAGVPISANVTFAGIPNAINVTVDPDASTATLTFTILGAGAPTFNFTGADLSGQIKTFLEDNLSNQLTAFIDAINTLSLVAVTDGTPMSTTALSATYVFDRFGLHVDHTTAELQAIQSQPFEPGLRGRIDGYYNQIDTNVADGYGAAIAPSFEFAFSENVSIAMLAPITYHDIDGSKIVNVHSTLAVPVNLLFPSESNPFGLRVTPFGTLAGSGSVDLVAGGVIGGGGLIGTASLVLGNTTLSASGQYSFHEGITLKYDDYDFDPGVSQRIIKAGLKATQRFGDNLYAYGSIVHTSFVENTAIDEYLSPGVGIGCRSPNGFNLSVGYSGDIADGYKSHQGRLTLQMPF